MNTVVCHDKDGVVYETPVSELSFRPSVYAVIIKEGKVLLVKNWGDGYEFPGGGIELGETIEEALVREVREETGLEIRVGKIVYTGGDFFKLSFTGECIQSILLYHLCEVIGGELSTAGFDEFEKEHADMAEWIDLSEVGTLKFYNSIDSARMLREAARIEDSTRPIDFSPDIP